VAVAADVPGRFDVVLNGEGYRFADTEDQRAVYQISPTFVPRQNVEGDYGDNKADFWMTATQRDWSFGEQQRFFRPNDDASSRKYWNGQALDSSIEGQVSIARDTASHTLASAALCVSAGVATSTLYAASSTNLHSITSAGTLTDIGAHGLGASPGRYGMCPGDGGKMFLSTTSAGTVGVRMYTGAAFSTWSASGADTLTYLNNTLFGYRRTTATNDIVKWDTAGTLSSIYTWKDPDGTITTNTLPRFAQLKPYGGKLLILKGDTVAHGAELWIHDPSSTGASKLSEFPANFTAADMFVVHGIVFIVGLANRNTTQRTAIYYWLNGTMGLLFEEEDLTSSYTPAITPWDNGFIFNSNGNLRFYDAGNGGISTVSGPLSGTVTGLLASGGEHLISCTSASTQAYRWPSTSVKSAGFLYSSLFDFDSSLTKRIKSVKVDYDEATDGDGGSVDVHYRLNNLSPNTYTSIQDALEAGTEYPIGQNARSVSILLDLNKGSSTAGPVVKKVYVRAAPLQDTFRLRRYVLDLSGRDGDSPLELRDGTMHAKDGMAMATNLNTALALTTPFSITDRFGTFTGLIDPNGFQILEVRPEEFVAVVPVREV
jgi:hypothetical protein